MGQLINRELITIHRCSDIGTNSLCQLPFVSPWLVKLKDTKIGHPEKAMENSNIQMIY